MQRPHALPQNQNEPMFRSKKESKNSGGWEGVADHLIRPTRSKAYFTSLALPPSRTCRALEIQQARAALAGGGA